MSHEHHHHREKIIVLDSHSALVPEIATVQRATGEKSERERVQQKSALPVYEQVGQQAAEVQTALRLVDLTALEPKSLQSFLAELAQYPENIAFQLQYQFADGSSVPVTATYVEVKKEVVKDGRPVTVVLHSLVGLAHGVRIPQKDISGLVGGDRIEYTDEDKRLLGAASVNAQGMVDFLNMAGTACSTGGGTLTLESTVDHASALVTVGAETALELGREQFRSPYVQTLGLQDQSLVGKEAHRIHSADMLGILRVLKAYGKGRTLGGLRHDLFVLNAQTVRHLPLGTKVFFAENRDTKQAQVLVPTSDNSGAVKVLEASLQNSVIPALEEIQKDPLEVLQMTLAVANDVSGSLQVLREELR